MRIRFKTPICWLGYICLAAVAMSWLSSSQAQQVKGMRASSFRAQIDTHAPPFEDKIKTWLEGERAEPQPGGKVFLWQPRLNRSSTNGTLESQLRSPECVYDAGRNTISSANLLQVEMADGRFFTEGRGFLWQTNGVVILSNQVHTVIQVSARRLPKK